ARAKLGTLPQARRDHGEALRRLARGDREHVRTLITTAIHASGSRLRVSQIPCAARRNDGFLSAQTHGRRRARTLHRRERYAHLRESTRAARTRVKADRKTQARRLFPDCL